MKKHTIIEQNGQDEDIETSKSVKSVIVACIIIAIVLPIIINVLMYVPVPTVKGLDGSDWLGFWGGYVGACISGACTLITIYITINYYEKQEFRHKQELEEEREMQKIQLYKPLLVMYPNGTGSGMMNLHIVNVSEYAAIGVKVDNMYIHLIEKEQGDKIYRIKLIKQNRYNEFIKVSASDCIGNRYEWKYELQEVSNIVNPEGNNTEKNQFYYRIVEENFYGRDMR